MSGAGDCHHEWSGRLPNADCPMRTAQCGLPYEGSRGDSARSRRRASPSSESHTSPAPARPAVTSTAVVGGWAGFGGAAVVDVAATASGADGGKIGLAAWGPLGGIVEGVFGGR